MNKLHMHERICTPCSECVLVTVPNDFVRRLPGAHAPCGTNAKNCTKKNRDDRLNVAWINRNRWRVVLLSTLSESLGVTLTVESKQLWKNRESHSEVRMCGVLTHVWGVNSSVTKHSDYFVWEDTSGRVTCCCDDTSWQDASEFLCIKTPLFLVGGQQQKNRPKKNGNALSDALLMSRVINNVDKYTVQERERACVTYIHPCMSHVTLGWVILFAIPQG